MNFLLAINDVLARKRLYATMLFVIMLSSFIMIVPQNLYHTISGEDFVTYIGLGIVTSGSISGRPAKSKIRRRK